jgi:MFS family permease
VLTGLARLNPFKTRDARRLALLFGLVYFSQGMWNLPLQALVVDFKRRGLGAGDVADFELIGTVPWLIKPAYGLLSDFVPLFGRRRQSYFLLMSALAAVSGFALSVGEHSYWRLAGFYAAMGLGLAFTDVLTDALMVENGKPLGLTGAFQSVQWTAIYAASIVVGVVGGYLAELGNVHAAFALTACFPLVSGLLALGFVHERQIPAEAETFQRTWQAIREAASTRDVWMVAGFIFFFTFSPSFGPAFLYYQTDTLHFGQQFIGVLAALGSVGFMLGAALYAPLSRRLPLRRLIVWSISVSAVGTLAYLAYQGPVSAVVIDVGSGVLAMITQLALLDLAAKACPPRVEGTFFALLMSVYNGGVQLSMNVGGRLYDSLGYTPLVFISAGTTALALILVPLVGIDRIEARARAAPAAQSVSER